MLTGARLQNTRNTDEKKDVVSEHEDKTHCSCNRHCLDPHHRSLSLRWIQLWQISLGTFLPPRDFRATSLIHFVVLLSLFFVVSKFSCYVSLPLCLDCTSLKLVLYRPYICMNVRHFASICYYWWYQH